MAMSCEEKMNEDILKDWKAHKKPVRLIALDLDGTLTNNKKEITPRTKEILMKAQDQGIRLILASGRPVYGIMPLAKELKLDAYGGYILAFNGGRIIECKSGEILFSKDLPADAPAKLLEQAKLHGTGIVTYQDDMLITEMPEDPYIQKEAFITKMKITKVDDFAAYVDFPVNKCILTTDGERMKGIEPQVKAVFGDALSIYCSEPFFLEVMAKGIDKAESLDKLLKILDCTQEELIAFGDGMNDRSMITYAGLGVCMANGQDPVKDAADFIAPSNEEDGVAYVVEKLM